MIQSKAAREIKEESYTERQEELARDTSTYRETQSEKQRDAKK